MFQVLMVAMMASMTPQAGETVELEGLVSTTPAQHLIQPVPSKRVVYVDFPELGQWVVYLHSPQPLQGAVRVRGRVVNTEGAGKRPRGNSRIAELQLDAESATALLPAAVFESWVADPARRQERRQLLVGLGKAVVPTLLEHLTDTRTFEERDIQNRMNLPPQLPPPPPLLHRFTTGEAVEDLLRELVTPQYTSPHAGNIKVFSPTVFMVKDWKAFWARREKTSLVDVQRSLEPVLDRYWQEHGTTQTVE